MLARSSWCHSIVFDELIKYAHHKKKFSSWRLQVIELSMYCDN